MKIKKLSECKQLKEGIEVATIADYITDHYKFETIDDKYACIDSIKDSHKDTISEEELEQFIGSHNGKDKLKESATHCVYFTQDGIDQVEFKGTEDECNKYISDIEDEQNEYFGDEWPERFIKRLNESMKDYRFEVSCNDGPTKVVKLIWDEKDVEGAKEVAKKYYAQEHTTYADDRANKWIIEESLEKEVILDEGVEGESWAIFAKDNESGMEYCGGVYNSKDSAHYWAAMDRLADSENGYGSFTYRVEQVPEYSMDLYKSYSRLQDLKLKNHNKNQELEKSLEEDVQYGVHQFSTDSIIFRGTEEECGKYIDNNKDLWDDAEVYMMNPNDPHYKKDLDEASYGGAFDIADDQLFTREDIDNLAEEVLNHVNETYDYKFDISAAYIDGSELEIGVENDELGEYITTLKIDMRKVKEPWHLKRVYAFEVASDLINQISTSLNGLGESLTESTTEDAKPIETGAAVGMATVLSDLIKDEYEAIDGYNTAIATAEAEGFGDMVKVLTDIQAEENIHIGQLQELMKMVDPNASKVEDGAAEAEELLSNPIGDDDFEFDDIDEGFDVSEDDIADEDLDSAIKAVEEAMKEPTKTEIDLTEANFDLDDEVIVESTEPWEDIYNSFKDIEVQLNGDGEAITATIDRIYNDNKGNPDFEKAYKKWAANE